MQQIGAANRLGIEPEFAHHAVQETLECMPAVD
jgi:hypothetical protein